MCNCWSNDRKKTVNVGEQMRLGYRAKNIEVQTQLVTLCMATKEKVCDTFKFQKMKLKKYAVIDPQKLKIENSGLIYHEKTWC